MITIIITNLIDSTNILIIITLIMVQVFINFYENDWELW